MKVFVAYEDWGYDGCSWPLAVFSSKEKAEEFLTSEGNLHPGATTLRECEIDKYEE